MHRYSEKVDICIVTRSISEILPITLKSLIINSKSINSVVVISSKLDLDKEHLNLFKILKKLTKLTIIVKDGPLGYLRNICVDVSNSEYIMMVDSDIVIKPNELSRLVSIAQSKDGNIVIYAPRLISMRKTWGSLLEEGLVYAHSRLLRDPPCGGTLYRRDIVYKVRFNDNLRGGEDHDLHKRLKNSGYSVLVCDDITLYHDYKGTIISNLIKHLNPRSSGAQHYSIKSLLIRTVASIPRGIVYMLIASRLGRAICLLLPLYFSLRWLFTLLGNVLHRGELG